jgi:hypothetical protein
MSVKLLASLDAILKIGRRLQQKVSVIIKVLDKMYICLQRRYYKN